MLTSERIREPAKCIGGLIRSCRTQWFEERADEVAKLERVVRAARVFQEFAYSYKERGLPILFPYADENNELTAALADLGALGG